jgi:hypothetical protein
MGCEDDLPEHDEASRRREEDCRREEAIRSLVKQHGDKRLSIGAVDEIALESDFSRFDDVSTDHGFSPNG